MSRKFLAVVAATSIAFTSLTAQPSFARDRDRDQAQALLGLAAAVLLGAAIIDNTKDRKEKARAKVHQPTQPRATYGKARRHELRPQPLPPRVRRMTLPRQCLRHVETRRGTMRMFGRHCLNKNYRWARDLPRSCERRFEKRGKLRTGFSARCLRKHGYSLRHG